MSVETHLYDILVVSIFFLIKARFLFYSLF